MMNLFKKITGALFLAAVALTGCSDDKTDNPGGGENTGKVAITSVTATVSNSDEVFSAIVNKTAGTVNLEIPFFIESINAEADLSAVKLTAKAATGVTFDPELSGKTFDFTEEANRKFDLTAKDKDGNTQTYKVTVVISTSSDANITEFKLENKVSYLNGDGTEAFTNRAQKIEIVEPEATGGQAKIKIYTTYAFDTFKECAPVIKTTNYAAVSPASEEKVDLSSAKTYTVTAQDGTTKTYNVELVRPELVAGGVGASNVLFARTGNEANIGFSANGNSGIAVCGDELVVNDNYLNTTGWNRYNRFTGELLSKKVNLTGMGIDGTQATGEQYVAITSDENGVLLAVNLSTLTTNQWMSKNTIRIFAWKNGLDAAPVEIYTATLKSLQDSKPDDKVMYNNIQAGRQITIKGSLSGNAKIFLPCVNYGALAYTVTGGILNPTPNAFACPQSTTRQIAIPLKNDSNYPFFFCNHAGPKYDPTNKSGLYYKADAASIFTITPAAGAWTSGGDLAARSDYKGAAIAEFNGKTLVAVINGMQYEDGGKDANNRLFIFDFTTPSATSFSTGIVFDPRIAYGYTTAGCTMDNQGLKVDGAFVANGNRTGSVCFGKSADGSALQVYMVITNHGLVGYELTKYQKIQ